MRERIIELSWAVKASYLPLGILRTTSVTGRTGRYSTLCPSKRTVPASCQYLKAAATTSGSSSSRLAMRSSELSASRLWHARLNPYRYTLTYSSGAYGMYSRINRLSTGILRFMASTADSLLNIFRTLSPEIACLKAPYIL